MILFGDNAEHWQDSHKKNETLQYALKEAAFGMLAHQAYNMGTA